MKVLTPCFSLASQLDKSFLCSSEGMENKLVYLRGGWYGEKGLADLTIICKKLHHSFQVLFLYFILSVFFLT